MVTVVFGQPCSDKPVPRLMFLDARIVHRLPNSPPPHRRDRCASQHRQELPVGLEQPLIDGDRVLQ